MSVSYESKTCRTCLQPNTAIMSLFTAVSGYEPSTISDLLTELNFIQIPLDECGPKMICEICYNKIQASYDFKLLCKHSDEILKMNEMIEDIKPDINIFDITCDEDVIDEKNPIENVENLPFEYVSVNQYNDSETEFDSLDSKRDYINIKKEPNDDLAPGSSENSDTARGEIYNVATVCIVCKETFKTNLLFRKHIITSHFSEGPVQIIPSKEYINCSNIIIKKNTYYCKLCETFFPSINKIVNHTKRHPDPYQEHSYCKEIVMNENAYYDYIKAYQKRIEEEFFEPKTCPHCKKTYKSEIEFKNHNCPNNQKTRQQHSIRLDSLEDKQIYRCPFNCGKSFIQRLSFKRHIISHSLNRTKYH